MQPPFDIAADLDTPVSAYLKLKALKPRFLLESVERASRSPRSTLSSRNRGFSSFSFRYAETGVSRSAAMSNGGCIVNSGSSAVFTW